MNYSKQKEEIYLWIKTLWIIKIISQMKIFNRILATKFKWF